MFLHWQPKTTSPAAGNCYFVYYNKLYAIVNNSVSQVSTFPVAYKGFDISSGNDFFIGGPASGTDYLDFYSVALPSYTALADPATMPIGEVSNTIRWAPGATHVAMAGNSGQAGVSAVSVYKRTSNTLTKLTALNDTNNGITSVSWSRAGDYVLLTGYGNTTGPYDGRASFLYSRSGDTFSLTNQLLMGWVDTFSQQGYVSCASWSPTSNHVCVENQMYTYSAGTFTTVSMPAFTDPELADLLQPSSFNITTSEWSKDGTYLAQGYYFQTTTTTFYRVRIVRKNSSTSFSVQEYFDLEQDAILGRISWSPDGNYMAASGSAKTQIYRKNNNSLTYITTIYGGTDSVGVFQN